jgi:phage tail protein X
MTGTATALQGDTLDLVCWRVLGTTSNVVEQAFALNPGLADLGPVLPEGQVVILPDAPTPAVPVRETVNLWD